MKSIPIRGGLHGFLQAALCLLMGCSAPMPSRTVSAAVKGAQVTAVYSRASKDYIRAQNPDGSFQPETYEFKDGGNFGGPRYDVTMDRLSFEDVSRVITGPLASQDYVASNDHATTSLLIVVYWGTTIVPDDYNPRQSRESVRLREQAGASGDAQNESKGAAAAAAFQVQSTFMQQAQAFSVAEAEQDSQTDAKTANILGYTDEILRTSPRDPHLSTLRDEIEHDRYYVVLLAYDYRAARRLGQHKLLWETRFSIPETGNDFEKSFPLMASIAAKYFGQDSHGLVHHNLGEGHVEVGEPKSLGAVPEK